jgi:hypothetical protein
MGIVTVLNAGKNLPRVNEDFGPSPGALVGVQSRVQALPYEPPPETEAEKIEKESLAETPGLLAKVLKVNTSEKAREAHDKELGKGAGEVEQKAKKAVEDVATGWAKEISNIIGAYGVRLGKIVVGVLILIAAFFLFYTAMGGKVPAPV